MRLIPMFNYMIVGTGSRDALLLLGFESIIGQGKQCLGQIGFDSEDGSKDAKDAFYRSAEELTRKGNRCDVTISVHKTTRYMTKKGLREFAKMMHDEGTDIVAQTSH